jgi:hypothetical protein
MPGLTDAAEDLVLDDIYNAGAGITLATDPFIALHTADPGDTGASNEVAGGSYARQQAAFSTSASGTVSNSANIDFTNMPSTTVVAWSVWTLVSAGTCLQTGWFSTVSGLAVVRSADLAGNDIQTVAHGLASDDRVEFEVIEGLTIPAGLTAGTLYFVLSGGLTTDAFNVSATSGGAEIDITAAGSAIWRKVTPKVVNSGDTFRIATGDLDIFATE